MPEDFRRVTRADVAKLAEVSETIVSYVMNNNRYVEKGKRARVLQAVEQLHYRPNNMARALKGKNSNHIVFIADQITNEHFSQIISEMDRYAYDKGYIISLCANRNSEEFLAGIIARQYDGVVISSISFPEKYIRRLTGVGLPVVLLENRDYHGLKNVGRIDTGLYLGARECVSHLLSCGRKNIIYLDRFSQRGHFSDLEDLRYRGFFERMGECGLAPTAENIITGCVDAEEVSQAVRKRLRDGPPVDAIFGRNDRLACIGMRAAITEGFSVPGDISVIGFDNSSLSQYTNPTLTTMEIQRKEIGRAAIEMLHQMIHDRTTPKPRGFAAKLIKRESTQL